MLNALGSPVRNLLAGTLFMLAVTVAATAAYVFNGWSWGDAAYMVVLTIYTVGYNEVQPVDTAALRTITMLLIVTGCTGMIFVTGAIVQLITVSQFQSFFGVRRMQKDIDRLSGHVIVCGFGRIGQSLAADLRAGSADFVIVDRGGDRAASIRSQGFLSVEGDATDENVLRAAGIERARAMATVLPDDAANVFITLSARSLNDRLTIIARGELPSTERKLIQAGADHVVLPTHIGAERIAELLLFHDMAALRAGPETSMVVRYLSRLGLDIEIVAAADGSRCVGASIGEIERFAGGAFLIVAIERRNGDTIVQPSASTRVLAGDGIAVVGRPDRTAAMQAIFATTMNIGQP